MHVKVVMTPPTMAIAAMGSQYPETTTSEMAATAAASMMSTEPPAIRLKVPSSRRWSIFSIFMAFFVNMPTRAAKMKETPHSESLSCLPMPPA